MPLLGGGVSWFLFLLPGGRPRRFVVISAIQAGGRPRRRPRPRARRSRLTIASSICTRSSFNSARILVTSILQTPSRRAAGKHCAAAIENRYEFIIQPHFRNQGPELPKYGCDFRLLLWAPSHTVPDGTETAGKFCDLIFPVFPIEIERQSRGRDANSHQRFARAVNQCRTEQDDATRDEQYRYDWIAHRAVRPA